MGRILGIRKIISDLYIWPSLIKRNQFFQFSVWLSRLCLPSFFNSIFLYQLKLKFRIPINYAVVLFYIGRFCDLYSIPWYIRNRIQYTSCDAKWNSQLCWPKHKVLAWNRLLPNYASEHLLSCLSLSPSLFLSLSVYLLQTLLHIYSLLSVHFWWDGLWPFKWNMQRLMCLGIILLLAII